MNNPTPKRLLLNRKREGVGLLNRPGVGMFNNWGVGMLDRPHKSHYLKPLENMAVPTQTQWALTRPRALLARNASKPFQKTVVKARP